MEFQENLKTRTRNIGLDVIRLVDRLPHKPAVWVLSKQILRSSTSVGANYRSVCRAKSTADFINKLKIVEEEADETIYWLEILRDAGFLSATDADRLIAETSQVLSIIVSSLKTTRNRYPAYRNRNS